MAIVNPMTRVISICNQKGGVGKTATAVNLSGYLAMLGKKVLLIDFDPQANASSGLGYPPKLDEYSIYHGLLNNIEFNALVKNTPLYNYHLIPSNQHLAGALVELVNLPEREFVLKNFIDKIRDQYDYIFIDLAPSLSLLTINGLVASDEIIIPVQCEYYSIEGISQILDTINMINTNLNRQIKISGAVLTMYDKREKLSREVSKNVRQHFPYLVFETEIPRCVAIAEAPSFSKPIILYNPNSTGAQAYEKLAKEIILQETPVEKENLEQIEI